jgi:hypothetical protein
MGWVSSPSILSRVLWKRNKRIKMTKQRKRYRIKVKKKKSQIE